MPRITLTRKALAAALETIGTISAVRKRHKRLRPETHPPRRIDISTDAYARPFEEDISWQEFAS